MILVTLIKTYNNHFEYPGLTLEMNTAIYLRVVHKLRNAIEMGGLLAIALLSQTMLWFDISKMLAKVLL